MVYFFLFDKRKRVSSFQLERRKRNGTSQLSEQFFDKAICGEVGTSSDILSFKSRIENKLTSLSRKFKEAESVEGIKDSVGCFQAARKERDSTISATSGNLPRSKRKKKKKLKKTSQSKETERNTNPGFAEIPWNLLVQESEFQK